MGYDKLGRDLTLILEYDANTTYIFDIHIYMERTDDLRYPVPHNREGTHIRSVKKKSEGEFSSHSRFDSTTIREMEHFSDVHVLPRRNISIGTGRSRRKRRLRTTAHCFSSKALPIVPSSSSLLLLSELTMPMAAKNTID
jgi:hypothetical protein